MMARALPSDNRLLSTVPLDDLQLLTPLLQLVAMTLGEMVFEPDQAQQFLYFPTSAIVSLHYVTESGASAESCSVGSEGVVGAPIFMGGVSTSSSAVVTRSGMAYRLPQQAARSEIRRCAPLQRILLRHTSSLIAQTIQIAACNRFHSVSQTLCRWLLTTLDRSAGAALVMTQELLASILGVRRESITGAALRLQDAGYIRYRRGHILVTDRAGLEAETCECYSALRREFATDIPAHAPRH
jgi:CRP-like cAMP-binding protein